MLETKDTLREEAQVCSIYTVGIKLSVLNMVTFFKRREKRIFLD